jgi:hypothetical protein
VVLARLQTEGQHVSAKIDRLTQLVANAPEPTQTALNAKIAVLTQHRAALGAKRHRINRDIAFDFAKTMTPIATASAVGVIAVKDLRGLQAADAGGPTTASLNPRADRPTGCWNTQPPGPGSKSSCAPRGTSALCPGCDRELGRPNGYHSASCDRCGTLELSLECKVFDTQEERQNAAESSRELQHRAGHDGS